jgi:MFS family permease
MFKLNKVIKILIFSDLALLTGFGFVTPVFAIFLTDNIRGGTVEVAGFAAAIYWVINSLVMIPFGRFLDKNPGEKDDLWFVVIGNFLAVLAVVGYIFSRLPWHIYLCQGIYGLGMAMNIPGYTAIFSRHIEKGKEALPWSVRGALTGIGSGVAGALGGVIAYNFGFNNLFIGVIIFLILSAFLPLLISKQMLPRDGISIKIPEMQKGESPLPK